MVQQLTGTLAVGALSSLIASVTVIFVQLLIRPRLKISPFIAREQDRATGDPMYRFKLINRSHRSMVEVRITAHLDKPIKVVGGQRPVHSLGVLPLKIVEPKVIPGKKWFRDAEARYALRVKIIGDLAELWPDDQVETVLLRVTARDGLTGTFTQQEQPFPLHDCVRDGGFGFGKDLTVHPASTLVTSTPVVPHPVSPDSPSPKPRHAAMDSSHRE